MKNFLLTVALLAGMFMTQAEVSAKIEQSGGFRLEPYGVVGRFDGLWSDTSIGKDVLFGWACDNERRPVNVNATIGLTGSGSSTGIAMGPRTARNDSSGFCDSRTVGSVTAPFSGFDVSFSSLENSQYRDGREYTVTFYFYRNGTEFLGMFTVNYKYQGQETGTLILCGREDSGNRDYYDDPVLFLSGVGDKKKFDALYSSEDNITCDTPGLTNVSNDTVWDSQISTDFALETDRFGNKGYVTYKGNVNGFSPAATDSVITATYNNLEAIGIATTQIQQPPTTSTPSLVICGSDGRRSSINLPNIGSSENLTAYYHETKIITCATQFEDNAIYVGDSLTWNIDNPNNGIGLIENNSGGYKVIRSGTGFAVTVIGTYGTLSASIVVNQNPDNGDQDSDGDGVPNDRDNCPDTPGGTTVDSDGCPVNGGSDLPRAEIVHPVPGEGIDLYTNRYDYIIVDGRGEVANGNNIVEYAWSWNVEEQSSVCHMRTPDDRTNTYRYTDGKTVHSLYRSSPTGDPLLGRSLYLFVKDNTGEWSTNCEHVEFGISDSPITYNTLELCEDHCNSGTEINDPLQMSTDSKIKIKACVSNTITHCGLHNKKLLVDNRGFRTSNPDIADIVPGHWTEFNLTSFGMTGTTNTQFVGSRQENDPNHGSINDNLVYKNVTVNVGNQNQNGVTFRENNCSGAVIADKESGNNLSMMVGDKKTIVACNNGLHIGQVAPSFVCTNLYAVTEQGTFGTQENPGFEKIILVPQSVATCDLKLYAITGLNQNSSLPLTVTVTGASQEASVKYFKIGSENTIKEIIDPKKETPTFTIETPAPERAVKK